MQFLYIYISLVSLKVSSELCTDTSEEEHRQAEEVADRAHDNMASAMKQDEHYPAPANRLLAAIHKSTVNSTIASVSKARAADDLYPSLIVSSMSYTILSFPSRDEDSRKYASRACCHSAGFRFEGQRGGVGDLDGYPRDHGPASPLI